jgi:hypothetical protein
MFVLFAVDIGLINRNPKSKIFSKRIPAFKADRIWKLPHFLRRAFDRDKRAKLVFIKKHRIYKKGPRKRYF